MPFPSLKSLVFIDRLISLVQTWLHEKRDQECNIRKSHRPLSEEFDDSVEKFHDAQVVYQQPEVKRHACNCEYPPSSGCGYALY